MPKTDLKIKSINANSGSKINTTVTYVNGSASSGALKTYAQLLNGLTNNIYSETDRIQTINVDTEAVPVPATPKPTPTITVTPSSVAASDVYTEPYITITASVNGESISPENIYTKVVKTNANYNLQFVNPPESGLYRVHASNGTATAQTLENIIMIPETDDYAAAYANVVLT